MSSRPENNDLPNGDGQNSDAGIDQTLQEFEKLVC